MSLLQADDEIGDRYLIESKVGQGGMQEVYRAYDQTLRRPVALKVPQDARVARRFKESAVLSARVNHPNVARTLDYLEDDQGRFFLIEELVDGLDLKEIAQQFTRVDPHTAIHVLHHLARGLVASHRVDVVHRDLKPSNILVAGGMQFQAIKITDFGIAKMAAAEIDDAVAGGEETTKSSKTARNALAYMAPEVIEAPTKVRKPTDVWAIAAIAWELLAGKPPFGTGLKAVANILAAEVPTLPTAVRKHAQFGLLAEQLHGILAQCFQKKPSARPTAEQLVAACEGVCYMPPNRELGTVRRYPRATWGFIATDLGEDVFFHVKSVVGDTPVVGGRVWFSKFMGQPCARAIPVVPLKT